MSNIGKATELRAGTPQCQFFVQRKKRLCRMTVKPGRQYCGEHEPRPKAENREVDKRIPCPNDPKHTVYASKLLKHLSICNARRTEQPPYIVENINAPVAVETCPRIPLSAVPREALVKLIEKINHLYEKYIEGQIALAPPQPIHHTVLAEFEEKDRTESSRRHLRQTSALLWIVEREGLVQNDTCYVELGAGKGQLSYYACHAWCGAGAGRVLAVDRAPLRHKRDNKLRSAPPPQHAAGNGAVDADSIMAEGDSNLRSASPRQHTSNCAGDADSSMVKGDNSVEEDSIDEASYSDLRDVAKSGISVTVKDNSCASSISTGLIVKSVRTEVGSKVAVRLRADLAHLALDAVPVVARSAGVVGLAKHLCGVATDYALRCVAAPGVAHKTLGLALATCCHHRCRGALYVGAALLQELGIDAEELNMMLGVVSWATCGDGRSRERRAGAPAHAAHSWEEREAAGRRAKALLDYGRVLWLRERGFEARLCHYVPTDVSLENVCLVAKKRTGH